MDCLTTMRTRDTGFASALVTLGHPVKQMEFEGNIAWFTFHLPEDRFEQLTAQWVNNSLVVPARAAHYNYQQLLRSIKDGSLSWQL